MELDITINKGRADKPVVVFIHGLGMNKQFWINPLETKAFAKNIPLKIFAASPPRSEPSKKSQKFTIGDYPDRIDNLWTAIVEKGFNTVCWSQRRPVGPMSVAVDELEEVIAKVGTIFPDRPVTLVSHSRGGLIARKFLEQKRSDLKAMITVSTPHAGSSLAYIGQYVKPMSTVLKGMLPQNTHGRISEVVKNITELLEGNAGSELLPGSDFFKDLRDSRSNEIRYLSFGGTETGLFNIYSWNTKNEESKPKRLVTVPDSLIRRLPGSFIPDELKSGKGDVLVTAKSSVMPWADSHYDVPANHISITWYKPVIEKTIELLEKI